MKQKVSVLLYILFLVTGICLGILIHSVYSNYGSGKRLQTSSSIPVSNLEEASWSSEFSIIEIPSSTDSELQLAYFFKSKSGNPQPLMVSLHTWSNDYTQQDPLSVMCLSKDINYIHPDFRGINRTPNACCSELALNDIDDAISYAIQNGNVDTSKIYLIGLSGGGYATLCMFMRSRHDIKKFSAWVPISDLKAWYEESRLRKNGYEDDILKCTDSQNGVLDEKEAERRSPLYWDTPVHKIRRSELYIYTGVYDGIQGSVPITHSINFYNKILSDLKVGEENRYVSSAEKLHLLEYRKPLGDFGSISGREICLQKEYRGIRLIVFTGNHEMLSEYAMNELLEE